MRRLLPALIALSACAPPRPEAPAPVRFRFGEIADSIILFSPLNQTHWGIQVYDPARDRLLYSHDASRHFIPASNTKLVVTIAAMGLLGPEYRYRTEIIATGAAGDTSPARVIALGRGDPTWSARYYDSDLTVIESIADSIRASGVRAIREELVIDASLFGPERVHPAWEVGDLPWSYAAPVSAFAFAEGTVRLIVTAGSAVGAPATAVLHAPAGLFALRSTVVTDTARARVAIDIDHQSWPDTIAVSGRVPLGRADTTTLAAPDATRLAAATLAAALERRGVRVPRWRIVYDSAEAAQLYSPADARVVASWTSVPLQRIVAGIMKPSQNWIAEQLLKTLGAAKHGRGTWSNGIAVERRYMIDVARIDSTDLSLRDASGLSAQNLITPRAAVQMLEHARLATWGELYTAALPQPSEEVGTLSRRLKGLEGRVMAKTGTIANVNSLSGFVQTANGRTLTFSILTNSSGRPSAMVRDAIDALVNALAQERDFER